MQQPTCRDEAGALLGSTPLNIAAKGLLSLNTTSLAFAAGKSGSITIAHDARFGELAGKAGGNRPRHGLQLRHADAPAASSSRADDWDLQTASDLTAATENELMHGSDQVHDLAYRNALVDEDWYRHGQQAYSSYEVLVEGASGDIGPTIQFDRTDSAGTTVHQSAEAVTSTIGFSRSLRWLNDGAATSIQYVRVTSGQCTTDCGVEDSYRIRAYETTLAVPRFNNTAGQITILQVQNPTHYAVTGKVYFWPGAGATVPMATATLSIAPRGLASITTSTVTCTDAVLCPGGTLNNTSGTITIGHNARYGDLAGKAVALDPANGYSFDTPMVARLK